MEGSLMGKKLAVIGSGAMGSALVKGLIQSKTIPPDRIIAADVDERALHAVSQLGVLTTMNNSEAVHQSDIVILAVKPQIMNSILKEIASTVNPQRHLFISIAAGFPIEHIEVTLPKNTPVVRVMPNTPTRVLAGASAVALGTFAGETHRKIAHEIFGSAGIVVDVPERLIDAVTALSGSGPAYVFLFIEALVNAGVNLGLSTEVATKLVSQTVLGSAKLILETGKHPAELKDMVTSPGGTTIAALTVLESKAFRGAIIEAVASAYKRAKELASS